MLFKADLAYMTAFAALHSHSRADPEKGSELVNTLYIDALSNAPYLTQGKTGKDAVMEERMAAVKRFEEMRKKTLKVG
jgi:hypothetical protein